MIATDVASFQAPSIPPFGFRRGEVFVIEKMYAY